jgi:hypothetical protein
MAPVLCHVFGASIGIVISSIEPSIKKHIVVVHVPGESNLAAAGTKAHTILP